DVKAQLRRRGRGLRASRASLLSNKGNGERARQRQRRGNDMLHRAHSHSARSPARRQRDVRRVYIEFFECCHERQEPAGRTNTRNARPLTRKSLDGTSSNVLVLVVISWALPRSRRGDAPPIRVPGNDVGDSRSSGEFAQLSRYDFISIGGRAGV